MNIFSIFTAVLLLSIIRTQPSTAQQSQLDCSDKLDIFFALDSSDSLTNAQFNQEKQLVDELLQRLTDTNRDAKAGYLTFTETVSTNNVRTLTDDIPLVRFELNRVIFDSEGTSLSAPLNYVYNNIFDASNTNLRPNSRRIFFLLTDGRDEVSSESQLANISRRLFVDSNVTTVTIGLGQLVDLGQLNAIATDPNEENVIIFSDFTEALGNVSEIFDRTCTIPRVEVVSAEKVSGSSINIIWISYNFTTVNYYKICLKTDRQSTNCNVSVLNIDSTLNQLLVQNLMPNTLYYITMFAFTDLGVTPISAELQVATIDIPGPPLQLMSTAFTASSITVTWVQPSLVSNIDSYQICFSLTSGGSCAFEGSVSGIFEYTQAGLSQNTAYYIRVRAVNSGGTGDYSAEITARTAFLGAPSLQSVQADVNSNHRIDVTWNAYTTTVISYEICVRLNGTSGCVMNVSVTPPTTSVTVSFLETFTYYQVSLVAVTDAGRSLESSRTLVRTGESRPGKPTDLNVIALSPSSIQISWNPTPLDQQKGIISRYHICIRRETGESCLFSPVHQANDTPLTTTHSLLLPNTLYRVRVRAENGAGLGSYTSDMTVRTDSLSAVIVNAQIENTNNIRITWSEVPIGSSLITGAIIRLKTQNTEEVFTLSQIEALNRNYLIQQVQSAKMYTITVIVNTTVGDTPLSAEIGVFTEVTAPTSKPTITITNQTSNSVTLTWTPIPLMHQNGVILFYFIYYQLNMVDSTFTIIEIPASISPLTYTITGLNPDTAYDFQMNANNSAGNGPRTESTGARTDMLGPIGNINLVSTSRSITVTYAEYTGAVSTGYIVCLSTTTSGGTCVQSQTITGLTVTFSNLSPAQEYYVTVTVMTPFGSSPPSPQQSVTTLEEEPGSPSNLTALSTSAVSIQILISPIPSDQHNGVLLGYSICFKESNSPNCTFKQIVGVSAQAFIAIQNGLKPNTSYTVVVLGFNSVGQGTSLQLTVTTDSLRAVVVSATVVDSSRIMLSWTDSNVHSNYTTGATLKYFLVSSTPTIISLTNVQAQSKSYTIEGLNPGKTYYFVVQLVTTVGTTPPSIQVSGSTQETEPTGAPTNVQSEIISATSIKILWNPPLPNESNGVITVYTICFGDQGQTCTETVVNASSTLEYIYTNLVPETIYVFQVRAHTGVGPGPYSVLQNQTTPTPGALMIERIEAVNATAVDLSWSRLNITVSSYEICVRESETGNCVFSISINDETQISTVVTNLRAYTVYYIGVTAVTQIGYLVNTPVRHVETPQLAPSGAPTQVTVVSMDDVSIIIEWGEVPLEGRNGIITTYEVCLQLVANGPCIFTTNVTAPDRRVAINGLTNNTQYIIIIRANTIIGGGPYSPGLVVMTTEPKPEEPVVEVTSQSNTSISIIARTPQTGAPITEYKICVTLPSQSECIANKTILTSANIINVDISNLSIYTQYSVVVTVIGPGGSASGTETITTLPGLPDAPVSGIQINSPSATSLVVTWEPPMQINWNDDSVGYSVQIKFGGVVIKTESTTIPSITFTGLNPNRKYIIIVTPFNSVGNGPTVTQQVPSASPQVDVISEVSIKVTVNVDTTISPGMPTRHREICLKLRGTDVCNRTIILPEGETNITITDLTPNTVYIVTITVINTNNDTSPSSPPVSVTTHPLAPIHPVLNLQGDITELFEIELNWNFTLTHPANTPSHFIVCLAEVVNVACEIKRNVTSDIRSVIISEIKGETKYYITVRAWNFGGFGPIAAIELPTPSIPPVDITLQAKAVSPFEIYVEWETRNLKRNVIYFTIHITDNDGNKQSRYNLSVVSGDLVFSSLTPATSYTINIEELPQISGATVGAETHRKGTPNSPTRVQVITISSQILRVTWNSFGDNQTRIQQWKVCYEAETFTQSSGCDTSPGSENYKTILDLEEYESYTITVRAVYSSGNMSDSSVPVIGRTEQAAPSRAVSDLKYVIEMGENKFIWLSPPLIHHNGIIRYYFVEFEYELNGEVEMIEYIVLPINTEVTIPYMVTLPYNVTVVPYTIGAGLTAKIINTDAQPNSAPAPDCVDYRVPITILSIILAILIVIAIVLCCILCIVLFRKKESSYAPV